MERKKAIIAGLVIVLVSIIGSIIILGSLFQDKDYYFGPYQAVIDSLYEDVLSMDGIDSIEIGTRFSEADGESRTWFEINGEGANCYLEDTMLFEEVFIPYLVENNDLTTALIYDCVNDCYHRHIGTTGDYLEIRINDTVYACSTVNDEEIINYQVWQCADETIYLEDYR